jgi:hypothetical protein
LAIYEHQYRLVKKRNGKEFIQIPLPNLNFLSVNLL